MWQFLIRRIKSSARCQLGRSFVIICGSQPCKLLCSSKRSGATYVVFALYAQILGVIPNLCGCRLEGWEFSLFKNPTGVKSALLRLEMLSAGIFLWNIALVPYCDNKVISPVLQGVSILTPVFLPAEMPGLAPDPDLSWHLAYAAKSPWAHLLHLKGSIIAVWMCCSTVRLSMGHPLTYTPDKFHTVAATQSPVHLLNCLTPSLKNCIRVAVSAA